MHACNLFSLTLHFKSLFGFHQKSNFWSSWGGGISSTMADYIPTAICIQVPHFNDKKKEVGQEQEVVRDGVEVVKMLKEEAILTMADDSPTATAIQLAPLNDVMLGIYPVEPLASVVDCEAVRPVEGSVSNDTPTRTIHI